MKKRTLGRRTQILELSPCKVEAAIAVCSAAEFTASFGSIFHTAAQFCFSSLENGERAATHHLPIAYLSIFCCLFLLKAFTPQPWDDSHSSLSELSLSLSLCCLKLLLLSLGIIETAPYLNLCLPLSASFPLLHSRGMIQMTRKNLVLHELITHSVCFSLL